MFKLNYDIKDIYEWPFKAQVLLLGLTSLVLIYFGYLLDLSLLRKEIKSSYRVEQDLKVQYKKIVEQRIAVEKEIQKIPQLEQILAKLRQSMISEHELNGFVDHILKLGSNDRLKFNLFDPANDIKTKNYIKTPVKINVVGTYNQIATFISQIANLQKVVGINDFTLSKEIQANVSPETVPTGPEEPLNAEINIDIYRK